MKCNNSELLVNIFMVTLIVAEIGLSVYPKLLGNQSDKVREFRKTCQPKAVAFDISLCGFIKKITRSKSLIFCTSNYFPFGAILNRLLYPIWEIDANLVNTSHASIFYKQCLMNYTKY